MAFTSAIGFVLLGLSHFLLDLKTHDATRRPCLRNSLRRYRNGGDVPPSRTHPLRGRQREFGGPRHHPASTLPASSSPSARFLVLLTSGFVRSEDQKAAEDLGVRHIILKPSTLDVLADAIHSPTPSPKPNTFLTGSNLSIILLMWLIGPPSASPPGNLTSPRPPREFPQVLCLSHIREIAPVSPLFATHP
jgi:hypothetical protein